MKNGGKKQIIKVIFDECTKLVILLLFKVAEHSFQVPIRNSPLLLSYVSCGARFLQESSLTTEVFILAFWLRYVAMAVAMGLVKNKV